jgi:hypothetical protein
MMSAIVRQNRKVSAHAGFDRSGVIKSHGGDLAGTANVTLFSDVDTDRLQTEQECHFLT